MPKNQFTQADFEESVRQRWLADNLKAAIKLIDWNRKVNAEIEEKQKQEQEKLEQQKLKDLKQQEQQQKASSSSAESPTEATGAIPKQRKQQEKRCKKKYKEDREQQQERDKQAYSNFKDILDQYFKMVTMSMASSLLTDVKKTRDVEDKLYEADSIYQNEHMNYYD